MSEKPTLYGFDGSTYVRTVRIALAEKGVAYDQVPVDVLKGEPRQPEHLARHPFGKVPVLDIDGVRIRETEAICRYLDETRYGANLLPPTPKDRARMSEAVGLIDAYGYDALIGAAGYHLFPDLIGGKNDDAHAAALVESEKLLALLMESKGDAPWLAGPIPTLADYFLGPILFYTALTPDKDRLFQPPAVADWWARISASPVFQATAPDLG
ncbi:MAG: glutathione S-transferase family protein [Pseudomonadota bacterium]